MIAVEGNTASSLNVILMFEYVTDALGEKKLKKNAAALLVLLGFLLLPLSTGANSSISVSLPSSNFTLGGEGLLENVPYVWQEINGFCGWAAASIALQYIDVDLDLHDVFAVSTIGFSYAYIHYNDTLLTYPGAIYTQAEPLDFLADLHGVNFTIFMSEGLTGASEYEQYWESQGINVGLLGGDVEAFALMRGSIDAGYPLIISVDPVWLPQVDYDVLRLQSSTGGAHGVVIVGYNDTSGTAKIMDPGVGSFGDLFGYPDDGRGNYTEITYTALNNAWSQRYYISNLLIPIDEKVADYSQRLGPMIRDKLLGVGTAYAPGSSSAFLWDFGERAFRKMSTDFSVSGLIEFLSLFDGINDEVAFKSSILLFMGLGIESAVTLQYLSYRTALERLPSLLPDIDLTAFKDAAEDALPHMDALSSNESLIHPGNLTYLDGLVSETFYAMSLEYNQTGDMANTLAQYSSQLEQISTHLLGVADGWLAAGNALAEIWSNNPFIVYGPLIIIGAAVAGVLVVYAITQARSRPSQ